MRLSEAITELLEATKSAGRTPATIRSYERSLYPLLAWLGDVAIESITTRDLRRYIGTLWDRSTKWANHPGLAEVEGGLSKATIASHVKAIRRLFRWLMLEGELDINPAARLEIPKYQPKPKGVDYDDFIKLLQTTEGGSVTDLRDRALLLTLADTGARVAEICGLTIDALDLKRGQALVTGKGDKSRFVFLSPPTVEAIENWKAVRPEVEGNYLFVALANRCYGERLSTNGVRHVLRARAKQAGVTGRINPHSFRHGYAIQFTMRGGPTATLTDIMGHSSIEITKTFYAQFQTEQLRQQHQKYGPLAALFGDGNGANDS